jgi:hypothetical protein
MDFGDSLSRLHPRWSDFARPVTEWNDCNDSPADAAAVDSRLHADWEARQGGWAFGEDSCSSSFGFPVNRITPCFPEVPANPDL